MSGVVLAVALGFVGGSLAGLFGVGGSVVFVPALTLLLGLTQLHAQATSLAVMLPAVAVGSWRHTRAGNVNWSVAIPIGVVSIAGVFGGALLARTLPPDVLRKLFAVFLVIVSWRLIESTRTKSRPADGAASGARPLAAKRSRR